MRRNSIAVWQYLVIALLMAFGYLFYASLQAPPKVFHVTMREHKFIIPSAYIPPLEVGLYGKSMTQADSISLLAEIPKMTPYLDNNPNISAYLRYQNKLNILIDVLGISTDFKKDLYFKNILDSETKDHIQVKDLLGMDRYVSIDPRSLKADLSDIFVPRNSTQYTIIYCNPSSLPSVETPEWKKIREQKTEASLIPYCRQEFFSDSLKDALVKLNYRREHLNDWKEMQKKTEDLISSFLVSK